MRINLTIQQEAGDSAKTRLDFALEGAPQRLYSEAISAAAELHGIPHLDGGLPFIDFDEPEFGVQFTALIEDSATLADVAKIFGDEIDAQPPTLKAGRAGRGGGGLEPILPEDIVSYVRIVGEVSGYVALTLAVWKSWVARYFSSTRRAAADWVRTGDLSTELRRKVLSKRDWYQAELDRTFALSPESCTALMTSLGYEFRRHHDDEFWVDVRSEELHNRPRWI